MLKQHCEEETIIFKIYRGPLLIQTHWYELSLGTCRSGDISVAPSRGEEHDEHDTIRLYKDTTREDAMKFGDPLVHAPTQQELNITERVAAYNADYMDKVARIDERGEECRKWKEYHRNVRKYRAGVSKESSSKGNNPSLRYK